MYMTATHENWLLCLGLRPLPLFASVWAPTPTLHTSWSSQLSTLSAWLQVLMGEHVEFAVQPTCLIPEEFGFALQ